MLPETLAWTLLERHCTPLREAQWVGHDFYHRANWADPAPDHVDLAVVPKIRGDTAVHPRDLGATLRLALAVARAVSCCRGFDTVTHPRFWRRAVESLWRESFQSGHGIPPPENASALSSTAFTHIALRWHAYDPEVNAFWLGFFHGTHACDVALSSVLESLGPYLVNGSQV